MKNLAKSMPMTQIEDFGRKTSDVGGVNQQILLTYHYFSCITDNYNTIAICSAP